MPLSHLHGSVTAMVCPIAELMEMPFMPTADVLNSTMAPAFSPGCVNNSNATNCMNSKCAVDGRGWRDGCGADVD